MTTLHLPHVRTRTRILTAAAALGTALVTALTTLTVPAANAAVTATWVRQIGKSGHAGVYAWGAATATDGTILVTDYNNYVTRRYSTAGQLLQTFGGNGTGPGKTNQPYGLGVDPVTGVIYVTDPISRQLEVYNPDGTPKATWDINPYGGSNTSRVAVNRDGWVYAVNSGSSKTSSSHYVNVFDRNGTWLFRFGSTGTGPGQTQGMRGIAIGPNDDVYVVDAGNSRILVFNRNGEYVRTFGVPGTGPGRLGFDLRGIALDVPHGWAYVSDASDGTIEKFTLSGTPVATFTVPGPEEGGVGGPREITLGQDSNLYVSDYTNERIVVFSPQGAILKTIPDPPQPAPDGGFAQPEGVAVDQSTGQVYVTDTFNHRVQRFSSTGTFQTKWGYRGLGPGAALNYPRGVSVATDGSVWVHNTRSGQVKHFRADGTYLGAFGSQGSGPGQLNYGRGILAGSDGRIYVTDSGNRRIVAFTPTGTEIWSQPCGTGAATGGSWILYGCTSVARDAQGNIWAAAPSENAVYKFSSSGTLLLKFGTLGSAPGQLNTPYGVAVRGNRVFVSELNNARVSAFDLNGVFQGSFGTRGSGHGQFLRPTALAFDAQGRLYVCDTGNERVEVFNVA